MGADFHEVTWDDELVADLKALVRLALQEDLSDAGDVTSQAVIPDRQRGAANVVARESGVLAGVAVGEVVLSVAEADAQWLPRLADGDPLEPGVVVGRLEGSARDLLACERTLLNLASRMTGVATLTQRYVAAVAGAGASVYDTRKTTPGWRRLEKYAVRCGGGRNHRLNLADAVMIKDNHLALSGERGLDAAEAVVRARKCEPNRVIQVEVDTLDQLRKVLPASPDLVLLDNMTCEELREAVASRDAAAPAVVLEASGGVRLGTVAAIAATGVDRISVGALTHSAVALDLGLDWETRSD